MASSEKRPRKGILKTSTSFDKAEPTPRSKEMKWDEMNILATHHPPDKDYGHMKIDEPPTPYSKYSDPEDDDDGSTERRGSVGEKSKLDPSSLSSRLEGIEGPRLRRVSTEEESSDEDEELSEEQQVHKKEFVQKRKLHYNEFQAVQLAKKLMEEEDDDDDDDNGNNVEDSVQMQTDQSLELDNTGAKTLSSSDTCKLAETTMDSSGQLETKIN
ncbi:Protein phosphatase inhibitor [Mactra antiquata]